MTKKAPQVIIPEHPEYGTVTKILYADDLGNFETPGGGRKYGFILRNLERRTDKKTKAWQALRYDQHEQLTSMTEQEARQEAVRRVHRLYQTALEEVEGYERQLPPYSQKDLQRKKELLRALLQRITKENPELKTV